MLFTIKPLKDKNGNLVITVFANDGSLTDQQSFNLTINAINDLPEFALSQENIVLNEDFINPYTVNILPKNVPDDEKDQELIYSILPSEISFVNISINEQTGDIIFKSKKDANGSKTFTVYCI